MQRHELRSIKPTRRTSSESFQISENVTIQRIRFRYGGRARIKRHTITLEILALNFACISNIFVAFWNNSLGIS
jgi:hypothetical protein